MSKPPIAPTNRPHKVVDDVRPHFAALTTPVDPAFRNAFARHKLGLAHTHQHGSVRARDLAVKSLSDRLGEDEQLVPGGVGYGAFYTPEFKTGWNYGTSIAFDIVCPTPPGGNVSTYL
jgi:hypothetical protein